MSLPSLRAAALTLAAASAWALSAACSSTPARRTRAATGVLRIDGRSVPVRLAVVGARDPGGFDGSLERCFFTPGRVIPSSPATGCDVPRRYGTRPGGRTAAETVDQVVLHYDAAGTSRRCFEVLHDVRGLSCHFLLDADGTVRQTLDLALRARHATVANDRSVGIEIAHVGAHATEAPFSALYRDGPGGLVLAPPARLGPPPGGPFRVARPGWFRGRVNGNDLVQRDFTEAQYAALERLLPELRRVLPRIEARVPRGPDGGVAADALPPAELAAFRGVLGHQHVQANKADPGPAFDWERIAAALGGSGGYAARERTSDSTFSSSGNSPVFSLE